MTVSYFCTFFVVQKCCDNSAQSRQVGFVCVVYIRVLFFPLGQHTVPVFSFRQKIHKKSVTFSPERCLYK